MDIKDYLVLRQRDAENTTINDTNNKLKWNIPNSYYSNQRSQSCSVCLINCYGEIEDNNDNVLSIKCNLTAGNQYNTSNSSTYLGSFHKNTTETSLFNSEKMILQTAPRPNVVEIIFENEVASATGQLQGELRGIVVVLQFNYYNAETTSNLLGNEYAPKL
tara:strand:+ start:37 stop:519 length:483 start_codon:yes stop_codon:yes gene_type:complete